MHMWQPIKGHHCTVSEWHFFFTRHINKQNQLSLSIQLQIKSNKFTKKLQEHPWNPSSIRSNSSHNPHQIHTNSSNSSPGSIDRDKQKQNSYKFGGISHGSQRFRGNLHHRTKNNCNSNMSTPREAAHYKCDRRVRSEKKRCKKDHRFEPGKERKRWNRIPTKIQRQGSRKRPQTSEQRLR